MRVPGQLLIFLSLWLLAAAAAALPAPLPAQSAGRATLTAEGIRDELLRLGGEWKFRPGDDPAWADPAHDDSEWMIVEARGDRFDFDRAGILPPSRGGPEVGWFRLRLAVDSTARGQQFGIAVSRGAPGTAALYLDGELLFDGWPDGVSRTRSLRPATPHVVRLAGPEHLIAVRYSLAGAEEVARGTLRSWPGLEVILASADEAQHGFLGRVAETGTETGFFLGLLLTVAVLHLLLFFFFTRPVANLFFALFALAAASLEWVGLRYARTPHLDQLPVYYEMISIAGPLSFLTFGAFTYSLFYRRPPWHAWLFGALTLMLPVLRLLADPSVYVQLLPWIALLLVGIMIGVLGGALWRRQGGAVLLGLGLLGMIASYAFAAILPGLGVIEVTGWSASYGYVPLLLAMSIHLARSHARTSRGFEKLSLELREINRSLEEKVAERTRELEEARRAAESASETKSQFLANMSHELRTPLNAILGYSEMLQEEAEEGGQEAFVPDLEKIQGAGKHLLGLINDILDLSKVEAGRMELYLERFDVERLLDEVAGTVRPLVEQRGNALALRLRAPGEMRADQTKLRQILLNLLGNAAKFTERGTVTLEAERRGERLLFRVRDTGIGMTPAQMEKLFQPFTQADASTTRRYGGTGLGLTISKHFAELMGGGIAVESAPGAGTTFTLELPVAVTDPRAAHPAPGTAEIAAGEIAAAAAAAGGAEGTVLVIDDDPSAREVIARMLGKEGFRVIAAASGEEGLRLAREQRPDVITLDVMMPGMDGWAVLGTLKSDPELARIPVVMVTMVEEKKLGYSLGAAEYLTKPVQRASLAAVLRRHLGDGAAAGPVLVVEDDPITRELLRHLLVAEGLEVLTAENGRIGLERVEERHPALVILDLMMPEVDGFEFLQALRGRASGRHIPVVVLTAKEMSEEDQRRLQGRVEQVLQKGARSPDELLEEVRRLRSRGARSEERGAWDPLGTVPPLPELGEGVRG